MAFRIENMEIIRLARNKGISGFLSNRIQEHGTGRLRVLPTDIDRQTPVNKDPYIIVTIEIKILARNIFKLRLNLYSKAEIVPTTIPRQLIIIGVWGYTIL